MLRVHRRHEWLDRVFDTLVKLGKGRNLYISIMADRPSPKVIEACETFASKPPKDVAVEVIPAPGPLVGDRENFMEALQLHYASLQNMAPVEAATVWDDDFWCSPESLEEIRGKLDRFEQDVYKARSAFLWDGEDQHNDAFPPHWQNLLFRVYRGDDFSTEWMVHSPAHTARSPHQEELKHRLLNAGYIDAEGRKQTFEMYKQAGKLDAHVFSIIKDPQLVRLDERGME